MTFGCEENNNGGVSFNLPNGAKEVNCQAAWVDVSNIKTQGATCAVGGATVTASGTVRGRDRECIVSDIVSGGLFKMILGRNTVCNCPGGGRGALLLQGTYKVTRIDEGQFSNSLSPQRFLDETEISLPSDNTKKVTYFRRHHAARM